ncbi:hypothetical protein [Actinopolymorpha alba]|uniref:hypothetical protein n=1 Tax=Actinopolymorpha alba TaxID=533267 RepID=UPI00039EAE5A|nr:hypothetical protein [Actinopolymorpha alba]
MTGHSDPCAVAPVLDGFAICVLPRGLGSLVTDFEYEWEGVTHRSRVWETGPDKDGAYRVDLTVKVMRGASLTSLEALRDYLADYHERDPAEWKLKAFDNNGRPGYRTADEAFWWEAPGVAVSVTINGERYAERDLVRTAKGLRAVRS